MFYGCEYAKYVLSNEHQGFFLLQMVQHNTITPTEKYLYEMHKVFQILVVSFTVYPTDELDMYIKNSNSHKTKTKDEQLSPLTPEYFPHRHH